MFVPQSVLQTVPRLLKTRSCHNLIFVDLVQMWFVKGNSKNSCKFMQWFGGGQGLMGIVHNSFALFWKLCIWRCSVNSCLSVYPCTVNSLIPHSSNHTISSFNHVPVTSRIVFGFPNMNLMHRVYDLVLLPFLILFPTVHPLQTHPKVKVTFEFLSHADCVFIYLVRKNIEPGIPLQKSNRVKLKRHLLQDTFLTPWDSRTSLGLLLVS